MKHPPLCERCHRPDPWHPDGSCHVFHAAEPCEPELKDVRWVEHKYSYFTAHVGRFRLGNIFWRGGEFPWETNVSFMDVVWSRKYKNKEVAMESVEAVVALHLQELFK